MMMFSTLKGCVLLLFSCLCITAFQRNIITRYSNVVNRSQVHVISSSSSSSTSSNSNKIDFGSRSHCTVVCSKSNKIDDIMTNDDDSSSNDDKSTNLVASYIALSLLIVTFTANQWARQSLYYLCDFSSTANPFYHINAALNFDKESYGLLSLVFTFVFAFGSLFAGSISDRFNRTSIIVVACFLWSVATVMQGYVHDFSSLSLIRALLAASQSLYNPAAYTLISDVFPKNMVGFANGLFSGGVYFGGGLASLSILLNEAFGWRSAVWVIGAAGFVASLACFVGLKDPRVVSTDAITTTTTTSTSVNTISTFDNISSFSSSVVQSVSEILSTAEAKFLYTATAFRFAAGFSIGVWKAPFIFAKYPGSESAFAGANALIVAVVGISSSLIGGYISDKLANPKDKSIIPRARAWVPAIGSLLAVPCFAAFVLTDDPRVAAAFLSLEYLLAECWFGPTLAALFNIIPSDKRGTAQGIFSLLTAFGNLAPVLVGALASSSSVFGSYQLQDVFLYTVVISYLICGFSFVNAAIIDDKRLRSNFFEEQSKVK